MLFIIVRIIFLQFTVQLLAAFKTVNLINLFYRPLSLSLVWSKSHQPTEYDNKINLRHLHHEVKLFMRILLTSKLMMPQWARDVIKHHQESEGSQLYWFTTMAIDIFEINLLREQLEFFESKIVDAFEVSSNSVKWNFEFYNGFISNWNLLQLIMMRDD